MANALYRNAIASIESAGSGDYSAVGPETGRGDRAYGRYQVMGANIPEWSMAALGYEVSPQEFLASPKLQDAIFDHQFGGYVNKYGPEGAASMWFSGDPTPDGDKDILGTSDSSYVNKFAAALGGTGQPDYGNALRGGQDRQMDQAAYVNALRASLEQNQRPQLMAQGPQQINGMTALDPFGSYAQGQQMADFWRRG
jgi:hypothetical protein